MDTREPEIWKPIPDYEGIYELSSWGNISSLERYKIATRKGVVVKMLCPTLMLKSHKDNHGYYKVVLTKKTKRKTISIHRLVAQIFLNETGLINHKDEDKGNNYYKNLECVSARENVSYSLNKKIGVCYHKKAKRWMASIWIDGKSKYLGLSDTEKEAHQAYLNALKEYGLTNKYADKVT
jgi:hypothetical protein